MSRRELKALDADLCLPTKTRSGKSQGLPMDENRSPRVTVSDRRPEMSTNASPRLLEESAVTSLQQQLSRLQSELESCYTQLQEKEQEVRRLGYTLDSAQAEAAEALENSQYSDHPIGKPATRAGESETAGRIGYVSCLGEASG